MAETRIALDVQAEGYAAHFDGKRPADNPYPFGASQDECLAWTRGFNMARTDRTRANRLKADGKL